MLIVAFVLQAGATSAVKAVKMSAKLSMSSRPFDLAEDSGASSPL